MKRIIICSVIVIFIIAVSVGTLIYISSTADELERELETVKERLLIGDTVSASRSASRAEALWKEFRRLRFLSADSDHIMEITLSLRRLNELITQGSDEALTEYGVGMVLIESFEREQRPFLENVL